MRKWRHQNAFAQIDQKSASLLARFTSQRVTNMQKVALFPIYALALSISSSALAEVKTLKIATGEYPPYATAARVDKGVALNIVQQPAAQPAILVK
jgi:hypothetical protein